MKFIMTILIVLSTVMYADYVDVKTYSGKSRKLYVVKNNGLVRLVDILDYIPDAIIDMKYSTDDSMFKKHVYTVNKCLVKKELAEKLKKANDILIKKYKKRIKFWDCYRPWSVQKIMWNLYPKKGYVAHPAYGSNHNRGCAVDITLVDLDGKDVEMPTKFDDLSKKANHNYQNLSKKIKMNRWILKSTMRKIGLNSIRREWWHYNLPNPKRYPVIDIKLEDIKQKKNIGVSAEMHGRASQRVKKSNKSQRVKKSNKSQRVKKSNKPQRVKKSNKPQQVKKNTQKEDKNDTINTPPNK